jgi:hypothetical protein
MLDIGSLSTQCTLACKYEKFNCKRPKKKTKEESYPPHFGRSCILIFPDGFSVQQPSACRGLANPQLEILLMDVVYPDSMQRDKTSC